MNVEEHKRDEAVRFECSVVATGCPGCVRQMFDML